MTDGATWPGEVVPEAVMRRLLSRFPCARVEEKVRWRRVWRVPYPSRWLWMHWFVCAVTLGQNRDFLTRFVTTSGPVIGVPERWSAPDWVKRHTIEHEMIHLDQIDTIGKMILVGLIWQRAGMTIGGLVFGALFLFVLPFLFTCRYAFERPAYKRSVELRYREKGIESAQRLVKYVIEAMSGPSYGWAARRSKVTSDFDGYLASLVDSDRAAGKHL